MDVRSKELFADIRAALGALEASGVTFRVLFLDASDDVLVRRFEQGRRPHPLQGGGRILDGIAAERELLQELRDTADIVLDTSALNVHGLATAITELFSETGPVALRLNVMSFGFKYGLPVDANFVADVRFIPNPHWVPQLRPHTGLDKDVSDYVLEAEGVQRLRGPLRPGPRAGPGRLPAREQALRHHRRGLHRRQAPLRGRRRRALQEARAVPARHGDHHAPGPGPRVMALLTGPLPLVPPAGAGRPPAGQGPLRGRARRRPRPLRLAVGPAPADLRTDGDRHRGGRRRILRPPPRGVRRPAAGRPPDGAVRAVRRHRLGPHLARCHAAPVPLPARAAAAPWTTTPWATC